MMNNNELNKKQTEAVESGLGPVLVVAGAGTGKTKVLTSRFEYLINNYGFNKNEIMAITFTNKAANEMKERLERKLNLKNFLWVGTFHSVCVKILREEFSHLKEFKNSMNSNFNIIDDDDQLSIIKEAYKVHGIDNKDIPYKQSFSIIEKYKRMRLDEEELKDEKNWKYLNIKNLRDCLNKLFVIKYYQRICLQNNLLDFNDLLIYANKVLEIDEIRQKWKNKFKYILVDEFQDTNDEQYTLIKKLLNEEQNLFVVGDPDQMIYSWRGAEHAIINNFAKTFKNAKTIILDINYRSNQEILDVSNKLIENNLSRIDKSLVSNIGYQEKKPTYFNAKNQDVESKWVCKKIKELINNGVKVEQIAILYRSNYLSRNIETELLAEGIKYRVFGGLKFYQRKEIKDLIAYLKAIYFADEISIKRIINTPRRGISSNTIELINKYSIDNNQTFAKSILEYQNIEGLSNIAIKGLKEFIDLISGINVEQSLVNVFDDIMKKTNYEQYLIENEEGYKMENIKELRSSIIKYEIDHPQCSFYDYLQDISLMMDHDEKFVNAVSLMTVHVSKGLEFDYVFVIGLNEKIFPSNQSLATKEGIEEERRIAYVAITRAKYGLFLSSFGGINIMYNTENIPSRFIGEIPKDLYNLDTQKIITINNKSNDDWFDSTSTKKFDYNQQYNQEKYQYKVGEQVIHTSFGLGIVMNINGEELTIYFNSIKAKKIIKANHISIKRVIS